MALIKKDLNEAKKWYLACGNKSALAKIENKLLENKGELNVDTKRESSQLTVLQSLFPKDSIKSTHINQADGSLYLYFNDKKQFELLYQVAPQRVYHR